jgi:hypothetical protein
MSQVLMTDASLDKNSSPARFSPGVLLVAVVIFLCSYRALAACLVTEPSIWRCTRSMHLYPGASQRPQTEGFHILMVRYLFNAAT